jgi:hypothetical protein
MSDPDRLRHGFKVHGPPEGWDEFVRMCNEHHAAMARQERRERIVLTAGLVSLLVAIAACIVVLSLITA